MRKLCLGDASNGGEGAVRGLAWLLVIPPLLVLTIDRAPLFVYAACQPYCGSGTSMEIEASTDGGYNWSAGSATIQGYPGQDVEVLVRTKLHVFSGGLQGWSFSVRHNDATLRSLGGDLQPSSCDGPPLCDPFEDPLCGQYWGPCIGHAGTDTASILPWQKYTILRTDPEGLPLGFTQGVAVANLETSVATVGPVVDFITAEAIYTITMPTGACTVPFYFVDDLDDGRAAVKTLAVRDVQSVFPCKCGFILYLEN